MLRKSLCTLVLAGLAAASLPAIHAQKALPFPWPSYEGVNSFISNFEDVEPLIFPGGEFRVITGKDSLGMALTDVSFLLFKLEPCTILQPHIHPHSEFAFPIEGNVTFNVVYNNNTFNEALGLTKLDVGPGGFAIFPTGTLHITQNEGCTNSTIMAIFGSANPSASLYPFTEGSMPANTLASYYDGTVTKELTQAPFFTAKLAGCQCPSS
jgi:quercetin dioxygenase-like cupin family protein